MRNVEVETDEKDGSNDEWDEGKEQELGEQAALLYFDCELVLLFGEFVPFAFHKGSADVFHTFSVSHDCFNNIKLL